MRLSLLGHVAALCAVATAGCGRPGGSASRAPARPASPPAAATSPSPAGPTVAAPEPAAPADPVAALRDQLASATDADARVLAIDGLADLGQRARPALQDLVASTRDPSVVVRSHAARAIGLIGEDAISALPELAGLLADPDPLVIAQAAAAIALVRLDDDRNPIPAEDAARYELMVEPLAKACVHADSRSRRAAVRALRTVHPEPRVLVKLLGDLLDDADPSVVLPVLNTLADLEDHALPVLQEALADPRSRYWAIVGLTEIGPEAAAAVPELTRLAGEGELNERIEAIMALAAIGEPAAAAVPTLVAALESKEELLQFAAAFALGKLRAAAADDALETVDDSPNEFLAAVAAWARAEIHPDDEALVAEAVGRLGKGLESADPMIRRGAVSGLSDLAASLDPAGRRSLATQFAELLDDANQDVGMHAGAALVRLGPDALDELTKRLGEPAHRVQALGVLAAIGAAAKPAVKQLVAALAEPDPGVVGEAAVAIGAVGPDAAEAVPALRKLLGDATPADVRYPVTYALGRIGAAAKAAVPRLLELSKSDDEIMATVATWAALKIEPADAALVEQAIPLLRRALRGERELARLEAAVALGDIGPTAAAAVPLLELVAEEDPAPGVRAAAAEAIGKIKGR